LLAGHLGHEKTPRLIETGGLGALKSAVAMRCILVFYKTEFVSYVLYKTFFILF